MTTFFDWLDELAGIENKAGVERWLDRVAFTFLVLMVVSAPHSIAATQTAWLTGMFALIVRLVMRPREKFRFTWLDYSLLAFFGWSVVSSVLSYAPDISFDRLRGVALFLIVYFVIYNVRKMRAVYFLAFAMIVSCMVNVLWTPVQRAIGRGVEIHGLKPESPLAKVLLYEGDALLQVNGKKISTPDELVSFIEQSETSKVTFYRPDFEFAVDVRRTDLLSGTTANERLGIESWKKSHNWRSKGFYGHYTTYAEVLQLIGSLIFGLIVGLLLSGKASGKSPNSLRNGLLLVSALAGLSVALLLTVTRASQLAFVLSAFSILLMGASRKWLIAAFVIAIPVVLGGLFFLQQSRQVGFFDTNDESVKYRETMWRDGARLVADSPRNLIVGVGMDSVQRYWREWGLYDGGRLPMGHFHSTPVQLLVERGLPALLLWLAVLSIYARSLWRAIRLERKKAGPDKTKLGVLLGCIGATIGFFAGGMVHYNLGDQEVAMVFYLLMGLGLRAAGHYGEPDMADVIETSQQISAAA